MLFIDAPYCLILFIFFLPSQCHVKQIFIRFLVNTFLVNESIYSRTCNFWLPILVVCLKVLHYMPYL
ncbi:hypothetical protein C2G38_2120736 [Gigaspora rosea]|uniref:Uncharacterized protein n=1 Tax=Gigaspora rosea TaxID=44941 RepID=A0A397U2F9_9GLOM|nr:hypothetical protein C2G38_2120736 [Gigaspora rosea]